MDDKDKMQKSDDKLKKLTLRASDTAFYHYDPLVGFWGVPNMERDVCFAGMKDAYIRVRHNNEGNRDKDFDKKGFPKPILCIGGSHTWGAGVEQEGRYTEELEHLLKKPVLNLGHCSLGLDQACLVIMGKSKHYDPSVVVVEQYPWAIHRVLNTYVNGYTRPYFFLDADGNLKLQKMPALTRYKTSRRMIGSFYSYRKEFQEFKAGINLKEGYDPWTDPIFLLWKLPYYEYMYLLIDKIIAALQDFCSQKDIHLVFVLGTIMQKFGKSSPSSLIDYDLPRKRLISILEKNRVAFLDMANTMIAEHRNDDPVLFADGHMNKKGHKIFAREIAKELTTRNWIKP